MRWSFLHKLAPMVVLSLLLSTPAILFAQQGQYNDQGYGQYRNQNYSQGNGQNNARMQRLQGTVLRTKEVEVRGTAVDILAAQLETPDGQQVIVDLGPVEDLQDQQVIVRKGDRITTHGYFTPVGEYLVFMASQVIDNGRLATVDRMGLSSYEVLQRLTHMGSRGSWRNQSNQQAGTGRGWNQQNATNGGASTSTNTAGQGWNTSRTLNQRWNNPTSTGSGNAPEHITGTIHRVETFDLPGSRNKAVVALLRGPQDLPVLALLGTQRDLHGLSLNSGAEVTLRGQIFWADGRHMVLARHIQADNQDVRTSVKHIQPAQRIYGQVQRVDAVHLPGVRQQVVVAQVAADGDTNYLAVLGPSDALEGLHLTPGDHLSLRGEMLDLDGQHIVLGENLSAHGYSINLVRFPPPNVR